MPVDRAKTAIEHLVERGLLDEEEEDGRRVYKVTVRGHQYLELYRRLATWWACRLWNQSLECRM